MVAVIETDAEEFRHGTNRSAESRITISKRQRLRIDLRQARQAVRAEDISGNIVNRAGQIADLAVSVEKSGLLLPDAAKTYEFHRLPRPVFAA